MKVTHVITGLDVGGAETMLVKLLSRLSGDDWSHDVVSLLREGPIGEQVRGLDIPVESLGMPHGVPDPRALARLTRHLRRRRPEVVQTWMYHADLMGGLAARMAGSPPVAWNIQNTVLEPEWSPFTSRATLRACSRLSRSLPKQIVCCSEAAARAHQAVGYAPERFVVIPNGVDLDAFQPDPRARADVRDELGVPPEAPLVGLVARFAKEKDHRSFAIAAGRTIERVPDARFVLVGEGVDDTNAELIGWLEEAGARNATILLGRRDDVPRLVASFDCAALSSITEAFPNVLGEAMAAEVPCVATDVGDAALIVGDTGRVVPARDPEAFARALVELLAAPAAARHALGAAARARVSDRFSLETVTGRYAALYADLVGAT